LQDGRKWSLMHNKSSRLSFGNPNKFWATDT
jgi:hypothetical protein